MAVIDTKKVAQETINLIAEKIRNLKTLNIIVAGKTGVGKSTLINAIFREEIAKTGIGKPVTRRMIHVFKEGVPLNIYDTRGLELGEEAQAEVKKEIIEKINSGLASKDINQAIHCIWYCINTASNRVETEEIQWLRELCDKNKITQVPIIVVLTQSFSKKKANEIRQVLLNENLDVRQVVPVLAEDYEIDDLGIARAYGLDVLIKVMGEVLPDELQDTLQNVQIASLEEKKRRAQVAVVTATAACAGEGLVPVPIADSAMMVATQTTMIATITAIFGFDVNLSIITAVFSSVIGGGGATLLGKTVFASLCKMIPGAGTFAGDFISSGTAGVITAALGEAYILLLSMVYKGEMSIKDVSSKKGKQAMSSLFKQQLQIQRDEDN